MQDYIICKRLAKIAIRHAIRKLRRLGFVGEASRAELLSGDDERKFTDMLERKGLDRVREFGVRNALRELSNHFRLIHLQAELNYRTKRGEKVGV